jgi:hypothetical protein
MTGAVAAVATFSTSNPLGQAVDNTELQWTTNGHALWTAQSAVWARGGSAIKSGTLGNDQQSMVQAQVTGPGLLTFLWRVASEPFFDFAGFMVDGYRQIEISGDSGWIEQSWFIPEGTHVIGWRYAKDGSVTVAPDAAWLDDVRFVPGSAFARAGGVRTATTDGRTPERLVFGTVRPK